MDVNVSPLDRLFEDTPIRPTLRDLKAYVARDLEAMLNTRREALEPLSEKLEVSRSLLTYGLPDFSAWTMMNATDRERIRYAMEEAIIRFEPRLKRVSVTLDEPRQVDPALRFRVDAVLQVDAIHEPVMFDAMLEFSTRKYQVGGA